MSWKAEYNQKLVSANEAIKAIKDGDKVVLRVSQLRLQAGPFVYSASADGAIIGADGKVIKDKNTMFMFM